MARCRVDGVLLRNPPLDALVLAMPISWKGTLQQYAGRLHREHADKQDVGIYDYVETDQPQLEGDPLTKTEQEYYSRTVKRRW